MKYKLAIAGILLSVTANADIFEGKPPESAIDCMAKNIYFEAKSQPLVGQLAVGLVVLNRVKSKNWPNDICKVIYEGPIEAPIKKDQKLAKLKIIYDQEPIGEYDLLALEEVKKVNIFSKLMKSLNYLIWGDV